MSATTTTRLALVKPTPGSGETVNVGTHLNGNWDKLDDSVAAKLCTFSTRPASPFQGQLIFETDTGRAYVRSGAAWIEVLTDAQYDSLIAAALAPYPKGIMVDPVVTSTDGTATSSTTETRDAVLGNYAFTVDAARRYRVVYLGAVENSVSEDAQCMVRIRDSGSASTPTTGSPARGEFPVQTRLSGSSSRNGIAIGHAFSGSAGVHTLSVFHTRLAGTGVFTPKGERQIYVEDIGLA